MKKILVAILTIFTLPAPSWADEITVYGTVVDENNEPLAGCWVSAGNKTNTVYNAETNYDGYFALNLDPTNYSDFSIDCSTLGYEVKYMSITPTKTDYGTIQMTPKPDSENIEAVTVDAVGCTELALKYANAKSGRTKIIKEEKGTTEGGKKALSICDPDCDPTSQIKITKTIQYQISEFTKPEAWDSLSQEEQEKWTAPREILYCSDECTESDQQTLKEQGAKKTKILNQKCIPSECDTPQYKLEYANSALAQCVDQVGKPCTKITNEYSSNADTAAGGVYGYDSGKDELFCYPVQCKPNYTLNRKTKKCGVNKCPCGQKQVGNECVEWNETDKLCGVTPDGVKSAERACDANGKEYCKIISCIGSEYGNYSLYELINPNTPNNKCVSQVDKKCDPKAEHATDGKLRESTVENKLFCAITECEGSYVPSDDGTKCEKSGCSDADSTDMKKLHATQWKWDNKKNQCIPTKCECGYGDRNGKPIDNKCDNKWLWDGDKPNKIKHECTITNATEAYMDCDASGKAYCRVHKCDEKNGYNIAGNQCVADACDPTEFDNAIYVKRVGGKCKIQECKTGYQVNKKDNTCDALENVLSEEESQERIKELQANEDALVKNEQKLENKLLGAAGIAGAGIGGQMLATGIAQRSADAEAERDMTAYLATFKCKYGNKMVDSGNKEIELPGANDQKYSEMYRKYIELASELKMSKASLGMKPGIESEEILDISNLYSNGNIGGADGAYTSLADALSGDSDAQKALRTQKGTAVGIAVGGGLLAAGAVAGTVVGNVKAHKDAPKNQAKEINEKYDEMRGTIVDGEAAQPAQGGGTNSKSVNKSDNGNGTVATDTKTSTDTDADAVAKAKAKESIQSIKTSINNIVASVQQDIDQFKRDYPDVELDMVNGFATKINLIETAQDKIDNILVDIDNAPDAKTAQELVKQAKAIEQAVKDAQSEIKQILEEQTKETVESVSEETTDVASSDNENWPFKITMLGNGGDISIKIYALGEFYYDCGDEKKQTLVVNNIEDGGTIKCENVAAGAEIKLGGLATKYDDHDKYTTIDFDDSEVDKWEISGSLGAIFPTLDDGSQPVFDGTFYNCTKLSGEIPANLFEGISGTPAERMFKSTFEDCSGLTGPIPPGLFAGIMGPPAEDMFSGTFEDCSGLRGPIPGNLFEGIDGEPAEWMFHKTFLGCSGLTDSIPENLFKGIKGKPAEGMFSGTFEDCSGLDGSIPGNLFAGISGTPAEHMFSDTFYRCSGLTGSIPENLFKGIEGPPAWSMFSGTFWDCSGLDGSIPANLFAGISGTPARGMFSNTFSNCSGLIGSIPADLFKGISGTPAPGMFKHTFYRCSGLIGSIPADLFKGISGTPAWHMFYGTFWGCSGLTGPIPEKLFAGINGAPAEGMFRYTFLGCSKLSGEVGPAFFGTINPPIDKKYVESEDIFHYVKFQE